MPRTQIQNVRHHAISIAHICWTLASSACCHEMFNEIHGSGRNLQSFHHCGRREWSTLDLTKHLSLVEIYSPSSRLWYRHSWTLCSKKRIFWWGRLAEMFLHTTFVANSSFTSGHEEDGNRSTCLPGCQWRWGWSSNSRFPPPQAIPQFDSPEYLGRYRHHMPYLGFHLGRCCTIATGTIPQHCQTRIGRCISSCHCGCRWRTSKISWLVLCSHDYRTKCMSIENRNPPWWSIIVGFHRLLASSSAPISFKFRQRNDLPAIGKYFRKGQ